MGRNDNNNRGGSQSGRGRGGGGKNKKGGGSKTNASNTPKKPTQLKECVFKIGSAKKSNECEVNIKWLNEYLVRNLVGDIEYISMYLKDESDDQGKPKFDLDALAPDDNEAYARLEKPADPEKGLTVTQEAINQNIMTDLNNQKKEFRERKQLFKSHKMKAYSTIYECCDNKMQRKINTKIEKDSSVEGDPLKLYQIIREQASGIMETRYIHEVLSFAQQDFFNTKQKEEEHINDYLARFKHARDVYKTQCGGQFPLILRHLKAHEDIKKKNMKIDLDDDGLWKINDKIWGEALAWLFVQNLDRTKYGDWVRNLRDEYSEGEKFDRYPKSLDAALTTLTNRGFDASYNEKKKKKKEKDQGNRQRNQNSTANDDEQQEINLGFYQALTGRCYCCGSTEHKSHKCPQKSNKSRDQWFDRTTARAAVQHVQTGGPPSTVAAPAPAPAPASVATPQSQTTDSQEESTALALPNGPRSAGGFQGMHIESFPG